MAGQCDVGRFYRPVPRVATYRGPIRSRGITSAAWGHIQINLIILFLGTWFWLGIYLLIGFSIAQFAVRLLEWPPLEFMSAVTGIRWNPVSGSTSRESVVVSSVTYRLQWVAHSKGPLIACKSGWEGLIVGIIKWAFNLTLQCILVFLGFRYLGLLLKCNLRLFD